MDIHGHRALTQAQAAEIVGLYDTGRHTQRELARLFGVSQGTISNIVTYRFYLSDRKSPRGLAPEANQGRSATHGASGRSD